MTPSDTRIVVQGSGNVGGIGAQLLQEAGYKIIALSDIHGGLVNKNGLNVNNVLDYLKKNRTLDGYPEGDRISNSELLEVECEVLMPAATENQITSKNVDKIKCRVLAEGANGPTTAAADDVLQANGVFVIPDILANAGGVTVSYFEWVQDRMGFFWKEDVVNERLQDKMVESFHEVVKYSEKHNVHMRTAAYMLAVDRVAYEIRMRGIYA